MTLTFLKDEQNHEAFQALLAAKDSLIPFVGAGFSSAHCPSWSGFLTLLHGKIEAQMTTANKATYTRLNKTKPIDYEAILNLLFTCAGKGVGNRLVKETFNLDLPDDASFKSKLALFHRAFSGPWITTNLDRFIEASYGGAYTSVNGNDTDRLHALLTQEDNKGLLLKIHGDAKEPKTWVLSQSEYEQAYNSEQGADLSAALPQFLERLFSNYTLLFIGCSLGDDRPLQLLKQLVAAGRSRRHFALVKRSKQVDDDSILFARHLSDHDITPIWLDDHDDINAVLAQLAPPAIDDELIVEQIVEQIAEPDIFVGREKELKEITDALQPGSVHTVTGQLFNLVGIGGIGKTTLAREVLHRCKPQFEGGCYEIRMDDISPQSFAVKLAGLLKQNLSEPLSEPSTAEMALQHINYLLNQQPILLLIDNVNDSQKLLAVLPSQCKSSIIITSRDQDLGKLLKMKRRNLKVSSSHLLAFNETEAFELFQQILDDDYQHDCASTYLAIAKQVDFLPIALRLALSLMIFGPRFSAAQLLAALQSEQKFDLMDEALNVDANYGERSIAAVFDLSTPLLSDQLKQTLAELAVCAPGPVPQDFLLALTEQTNLLTSLNQLVRYSWCQQSIKDEVTHYELHQLVREHIRQQLVGDNLQERHAVFVQRAFIEEPEHFLVLDRWLSQTDLVVLRLKAQQDERLIWWAATGFGQFCINRGYGEQFVNNCQWVREVFSHDQAIVAMALGNQALVLKDWGQLDEAMVLHQKQEEICQALDDQAGLSRCYGNQAGILQAKGQLDQAMVLHQKEEKICQALDDRAGLSACYGNQALILKAKGQLDQAMLLHQKQEEICQSLGDQAGLSVCYGNQAIILQDKGQLDEALVLYQKQEAICQTLGDRAQLSRSYWNQGCLQEELGKPQDQKQLWLKSIALKKMLGMPTEQYEEALAALEKSLDP